MNRIFARFEIVNLVNGKMEDMEDADLVAFVNQNFKTTIKSNGDGTFSIEPVSQELNVFNQLGGGNQIPAATEGGIDELDR